MTKQAHITSRPDHSVGDKVLGLCGKGFRVKVLWADLPKSKPICRDCVDAALLALTEADLVIESSRYRSLLLTVHAKRLADELEPEDGILLDQINDRDREHAKAQQEKRVEKVARKRLKQTCTCTWTSPEIFTEDPLCPIHGGEPTAADFSGVQGVQESDIRATEEEE